MNIRKKTKSNGLTEKQTAALPHFIAPRSIEAGCRSAKVSKSVYYGWLKQDTFKVELEALREQTLNGAISCLKAGIVGAVEKILTLLESNVEAIQLRAAQAALDYYLKVCTVEQVEERLAALENAVEKDTNRK